MRARSYAAIGAAAGVIAGCGGGGSPTVTVTRPSETTPAAPAPPHSAPASSAARCTDAACATRVVTAHGFTANAATFDPARPLNVLVGVRTGSADGTAQNAFFFWQGRYIGTDTADISAGVKVASQSDSTATLVYRLYNPNDPQCCATAGERSVRYRWNGSRLVPLDPIPTSTYSARGSRR